MRHGCGASVWECQTNSGWKRYDDHLSEAIEHAFLQKLSSYEYTYQWKNSEATRYVVKFGDLGLHQQYRKYEPDTKVRPVRRMKVDAISSYSGDHSDVWVRVTGNQRVRGTNMDDDDSGVDQVD